MAFACSKKIELTRLPEPFMLVNLNPFITYEDKSFEDIGMDYQSIDHWSPPAKQYRKEGSKFLYYSELDSNTLIYLSNAPIYGNRYSGSAAIYLIRPCNTESECAIYEDEHPITDIFKYEFLRFQREGLYQTTQEYADSISDNIIEKLKAYTDSTNRNIYEGLVYNDRCYLEDDYGSGEPKYYDFVTETGTLCPRIPLEVLAEFDSCNAMLDAQEIKIRSLPQVSSARLDIQGRQISASGIEGPTEITIFSLMGQTLERHRVSGKKAIVVTDIPTGSYIVQARSRNNSIVRKMFVR